MEPYITQALAVWSSPAFQELLAPVRTLGSISGMFWMLARLADLLVAVLKRLVFEELSTPLNFLYVSLLSVIYAAMMFYTALNGQWHPSLLWREVCGFAFMYVMLGVAFTDSRTRKLKPNTTAAFFLGVCAYFTLVRAPGLARLTAVAEFHRVLELFAAGGWGAVMTAVTVMAALWLLLRLSVSEIWFGLSPIMYRLRLIKKLPVRFELSRVGGHETIPSLARSWFILTLLAGGVAVGVYWWPKVRAAGAAAVPALQDRAQSPEAAAAASRLGSVLPAVSFAAVRALSSGGPVADLALPVFRNLLLAPREADRWLAAAALDRLDPAFSIAPEQLFTSTAAAVLPCARGGRDFKVLALPLPGEQAGRSAIFWIADSRGVHFTGVGPGELRAVAGSTVCAVAAFGRPAGPALLAFTEAPQRPGAPARLWLSAYDPARRAVLGSAAVAGSASGEFSLAATRGGVTFADAPSGPRAAACSGDCGTALGARITALTTEPLVEYRGAAEAEGEIKMLPLPERTYARSGLRQNYRSQSLFNAVFSFDPAAGFLNRWYRLAVLSDGRRCVSAALDPALPGVLDETAWACDR